MYSFNILQCVLILPVFQPGRNTRGEVVGVSHHGLSLSVSDVEPEHVYMQPRSGQLCAIKYLLHNGLEASLREIIGEPIYQARPGRYDAAL